MIRSLRNGKRGSGPGAEVSLSKKRGGPQQMQKMESHSSGPNLPKKKIYGEISNALM